MIDIKDIVPGQSYACKFRVETTLDEDGKVPGIPTFGMAPIKGSGIYEGFGVILVRDIENEQVKVRDEESLFHFVVPFKDIWDVDSVEWVDAIEDDEESTK